MKQALSLLLATSFYFPISAQDATTSNAVSGRQTAQTITGGAPLQADPILDENKRIQTDVFVLNTCEPTQLSLVRLYDDNRIVKKLNVRRLSVSTKRLSAFKITNINPLRYNYYINNQLVTNFMDVAPADFAALNGASRDIQEIEHLNLFSDTFSKTEDSRRLRTIEATIDSLTKKLADKNADYSRVWSEIVSLEKFDNNIKEYIVANDDDKPKYSRLKESSKTVAEQLTQLNNLLLTAYTNYENISNSLPINDRHFPLLDRYSELTAAVGNKNVDSINKSCLKFAQGYKQMSRTFDSVDSAMMDYLLPAQTSERTTDRETSLIRLLRQANQTLFKYGYTSAFNAIAAPETSSGRQSHLRSLEAIIRLKSFMLNKKYKAYEAFVITTASDIARILQDNYREYSEKYIEAANQTCLNNDTIAVIKNKKEELKALFRRIEEMSVDFKVITSYLGIDNQVYKPLIDSINKSYRQLYKFVKYSTHIAQNSTVEYSLPTHTNLKNVDIVRYEIKREDKLANAKQTQVQSYVYDLWLKGGLKVDLSAGIFASALSDDEYSIIRYSNAPNPAGFTGDSIGIFRRDKGGYSFAFGGMVNITPRAGANWVNLGMSYGVTYSSNQKLQFLSALSLHIGKMERLIIHGGVTMGFVQTIDRSQFVFSELKRRTEFALRADFETFKVPYVERFRTAPFFGITYNITKRNALQAVSDKGLSNYESLIAEPKVQPVKN
jgi:hypothetical protein